MPVNTSAIQIEFKQQPSELTRNSSKCTFEFRAEILSLSRKSLYYCRLSLFSPCSTVYISISCPYIHYGELFGYNEVIDRIKSTTNTQPIKKSSGRDILFPASDVTPIGLGRCSALQSNDILLGGDIIILELKNEYAPAYISYIINQNKQQIINRVTGTTVKHINSRQLSEIIIEITKNKKEQMVIATILSDMDKEIVDLEARRDKYKLIKSGMMQKLLTGQIRLI